MDHAEDNRTSDADDFVTLSEADLAHVAGGLNPQPLPPRHSLD